VALLNQFIDFEPIIDNLWAKFEPKIDEQMNKAREEIVKAAVLAVTQTAGQLLDKTADAIPGQLDDWVIGQAKQVLVQFGINL